MTTTDRDELIEGLDAGFCDWLHELEERVIQGEYGYELGEFEVYPELWRPLFNEGLTPKQAWQRALDAHRERRMFDDATRAEQWVGILMHDAAASAALRSRATSERGR